MSKKSLKTAAKKRGKTPSTKASAKPAPAPATKVVTPTPPATATKAPKPPAPRDARLPAPGTTATREYKGKNLKVKYLEDGVEVDGTKFDSLSAAARAVTGAASINGFLWFGLTGSRPARVTPATTTRSTKRAKKPDEPKIGHGNEIGTPAGQREALEAVLGKKPGRPISKPLATTTKGGK